MKALKDLKILEGLKRLKLSTVPEKPAAVNKLIGAYESLEERDRKALLLLSSVLACLVLYFGIWSPVNQFHANAKSDRDRQLELIQWMRSTEKEARSSGRAQRPGLSGQSLLTQLSRTAKSHNVTPNRLQPEGADGVSVWFDSVAFNDLIKWLQQLQKQEGVVVKQISIDGQAESGRVSARMVLDS